MSNLSPFLQRVADTLKASGANDQEVMDVSEALQNDIEFQKEQCNNTEGYVFNTKTNTCERKIDLEQQELTPEVVQEEQVEQTENVLEEKPITTDIPQISDTWLDASGNPVSFEYPEIKISSETEVEEPEQNVKKPSLLDKLGNINIYRGKTLKNFFDKKEEEVLTKDIDVDDDVKIDLPTEKIDQTKLPEVITPEVTEEYIPNYYYDEDDNQIKSDRPETIQDILEKDDRSYTTDVFTGERIYLDEKEKEEKEEPTPEYYDDYWVVEAARGIGKLYDLGKSLYKDEKEQDELYDNIEKRYFDINNNLGIAGLSIYIDGLKLAEKSLGESKKAGLVALDDMFGDYGDPVWLAPTGEIIPLNENNLSEEQSFAGGYNLIYEDSGVKVGDPYRKYVVGLYEKQLEIELLKNNPKLSITGGYKEGDPSQFFGGTFNAIASLTETMLPALTTKGLSLIPQITAPMYVDANREKAKRLYPNLTEAEAIEKIVMNGEEDVLIPNLLGLTAGSLERFGFKGIIKAITLNPKALNTGIANIIYAGQREGLTELGQTGLEVYNGNLAAGEERAGYLAWAAMCGPQGLEAYLQGAFGGTTISTGGQLISRAIRTNSGDIRKINNNIRKTVDLKRKKEESISEKMKDYFQGKIEENNKDLEQIIVDSTKLASYLTKKEQDLIISLLQRYDAKTLEYNTEYYDAHSGVLEFARSNNISVEQALKENYPKLDAEWQTLKNALNNDAGEILNDIDIIRKRANERMIDDGITKGRILNSKGDIELTVFESQEDVDNWVNDSKNQDMFEKQAKEEGLTVTQLKNRFKKANGWELDGEVFVNKNKAIEVGVVTVVEHEIAHILYGNSLRKNGDMTAEGVDKIIEFINVLPPSVLEDITRKLVANGYNLQDPNHQEEFITFYIDGVIDGSYVPNRKALKLLGTEVESLMKSSGYTNIKFKTIQDVLDWIISYKTDKESGKSKVKRNEPKRTVNLPNFSVTDLEGPINEFGNVDQETWNKNGFNKAYNYIFGKLDGIIMKYIPVEIKKLPDFDQENHIQQTMTELIPHIRNFKPAEYNEDGSRKRDGEGKLIGNDSLWGWIVPFVKFKGLNALEDTEFVTPVRPDDTDNFTPDIPSDDFLDLDAAIEEDVTYTALRGILGIKRNGELHNKIKKGIQKIIPLEIKNLDTPKFKNALKKYFRDYLFDDIKELIGGKPGGQKYKNFITNNGKALYNLFPQKVFNKQFQNFIVKGERLTVPETRKAQKEGLVDKNLTDKQMADGIYLYTKLPWNDDTEQKWIDNFLNPPKGRPASKQNALIEIISNTLGIDATMEVINSPDFMKKHDLSKVVIATIGMKIDRGANVRFNTTDGEVNLNSNNFNTIEALDMVRFIESEIGFDEAQPDEVDFALKTNFPEVDEDVRSLIVKMADTGTISNMDGKRFKQVIKGSKEISKKTKDQIKEDGNIRYNKPALDKLNDAANIIAPKLGPEIMGLIGYDILGYIRRVMNPAKRQKNPEYEYDKSQPKYIQDEGGNEISAPYYDALEALKIKVQGSKVKLPEGLNLDDIRLVNKKFPLLQTIDKILFNGNSKIDGSNIKWKQAELAKLAPEIKAASEANLKLAKYIAKTIIESNIDGATKIHMLQLQTNAVSGFRALTSLDLITVLEGSQEPGVNHPYFKSEFEAAKKERHTTGKNKGKLKYPTEKLAEEAAIKALSTKGEHVVANANTMAKIAILDAKYQVDKSINLDLELEKIFQSHGQIHGTKGTFNILDKFGTNNIADWLRIMLAPRRKNMFSPDGKTSEEVVAEKIVTKEINEKTAENKNEKENQTSTSRFSTTDLDNGFNEMLEENEGVKKHAKYSDAKANILGSKVVKFWDFIYPPSAYDLELFLYRIIGKGKKGEKDLKFFKDAILDPYNEAYSKIQKESQRAQREYRELVKKLPKVRKKLSKKVPGSKFTYDQAIRVAIWTDMGVDMQEMGLSKADQKILVDTVKGDTELTTFKEALKNISRDKDGYVKPSNNWTVENIAYDINMAINSVSRSKFLAEWKENVKAIFNDKNLNKLKAIYGEGYVEALNDMLYRMEYGRGKSITGRIERNWNNWVNNSVGAIMFFNFRSAVLQTISTVNYIDWSDNNPAKAALAFANFPQFVKDVVYIFNSDYLLERRGGNRRTVNEAELTQWLKGKQNKAKAIISFLLEKGFTPTQIADSFAISTGGASFYRNKVKKYLKEGFNKEEAEKKAFKDFIDKTEKGQQSSRPDLISQQQAGGLGRLILAFKNTPMQYNRLMIKAILDLKNRRGKVSENLSKIAYYGLIQNVIFTSLQTALFAALGDEEEWDTKKERVANGMIDSILNGMGLTGAIAATIKNGYLRYSKEKKRGWNADHTRTIIEFANLSPTIGSKLRKLYSSIRGEQLNQEAIEAMGFNIENPAFNSMANLISATTNVPLDRAVTIAQNLVLASKDETEFWESMMLVLGWNAWDIGLETTSRKVQIEQKEIKKKEKKKAKKVEAIEQAQDKVDVVVEEEVKKEKEGKGKDVNTCAATRSDGSGRCSVKVDKAGDKCQYHASKEEKAKMKKCGHIKKNGKQCGNFAVNDAGRCNVPQHQPGYKKK